MEILKNYKPEAIKKSSSNIKKYPFREMEIGDCIIGDDNARKAARVFESRNNHYHFIYEKIANNKYAIIRARLDSDYYKKIK